MSKLQIEPSFLTIIKAILRQHVPEFAVWAFGSRVLGTQRPTSDLDLVILTIDPLPIDRLAGLREDLVQAPIPMKVDLVDWASTSDEFRSIIKQAYVIIQQPAKFSQTPKR